MINGKRIAVVMPAYNAEKTLEQTVQRTVRRGGHQDPGRRLEQGPDRGAFAQAGRADIHPRRELRIRAQPADLLSRGAGGRGGHRGDGASRLPVHTTAGSGHGGDDRQRRVRHGSGDRGFWAPAH